jgi:hypothetical protein
MPSPFVTMVRAVPVSTWVTVMATPGRTPPLGLRGGGQRERQREDDPYCSAESHVMAPVDLADRRKSISL